MVDPYFVGVSRDQAQPRPKMSPEYLGPGGTWDINGWRSAHILSDIARYIDMNPKIIVKIVRSIGIEQDEDGGGEGGEAGEAGEGG